MESMMLIYEAVKEKLNTPYTIFFQTMQEDKVNNIGIYLYESANDRQDIEGDVVYNNIKVHVQLNTDRNITSLQKGLDMLADFTRRIESEQSAVSGIEFIEALHQGPRAVPIGRNQFDILICRSVIDLKYIFSSENNDNN